MRVKVGNEWFDPRDVPLCIELTETDKKNIANMNEGATKYAVYDHRTHDDRQAVFDWMDDKANL